MIEPDLDDDFIVKPSYFTAIDPYEYTKTKALLDELSEWFSPAQSNQIDLWRTNERNRREEAADRRKNVKVEFMPTEEFDKESDWYSVAKLFNARDSMLNYMLKDRGVAEIVGEHVDVFIPRAVHKFAARLHSRKSLVEHSMHAILGDISDGGYVSLKALRRLCWILAANKYKLQAGDMVPAFDRPADKEWAPALTVNYFDDHLDKRMGVLEFFILGGSGATYTFRRRMPFTKGGKKFMEWHMFSMRTVTTRINNFRHLDYVGMRTWVLLDPGHPRMFEDSCCDDIFSKQNRQLPALRRQPCERYPDRSCFSCPLGLDSCARATHKDTYVEGYCSGCNRETAWFVSEYDPYCRVCIKKERNK